MTYRAVAARPPGRWLADQTDITAPGCGVRPGRCQRPEAALRPDGRYEPARHGHEAGLDHRHQAEGERGDTACQSSSMSRRWTFIQASTSSVAQTLP
jgi:hypothetical protein